MQADSDRVHMLNTLGTVLLVLTGIAFLVWFFAAYRNVSALGRPRRYGVGWAIGGWLVPVVGLWFPLRMTTDINGSIDDEFSREWERTRRLANAWWAAWIALTVLSVTANGAGNGIKSADRSRPSINC